MRAVHLVLCLSLISTACDCAAGRPNIVVIIADDMAWDDCGVFGHPTIRTPNIDGLAAAGMRFENAFLTISSCSPSRCSILTGLYPHNTDAEELHWPLPANQVTFVEHLKSHGYWTGAAGKWHLGNLVRDRFDVVREVDTSGFQLPADGEGKRGEFVETGQGDARSGCTDWIPLLRERPTDKPFFLWLAAVDPHRPYSPGIVPVPHQADDVRVPPYQPDTLDVRADYANYYDEIQRLDEYVGRVINELIRQQILKNTVVIFFSDNGRPFPRDKTTLYDSGIKTPLIVRWPATVRPNSTTAALVSTVDLAPTIMEIAGIQPLKTFAGVSLLPLLTDTAKTIRSFIHAEKNWHDYEDHARAVRDQRYKYIRNYFNDLPNTPPADAVRSETFQLMRRHYMEGTLPASQTQCFVTPRPREELYDVLSDPHELRNLAADARHQDTLARFRDALRAWELETNDTVPQLRTADEFDRGTGKPNAARRRPRWSKQRMVDAGLVSP